MNFSRALDALTNGYPIRRAGWNGKGMSIWLQRGASPAALAQDSLIDGVSLEHFELADAGTTTRMPCICMTTAKGNTVTGWLASQTDLLAEDWEVAA